MKKRKIIVTHATSNDNEIIFYLSSQLNSYVKGGYINNKNYMYISIENKNSSEEFRKSCKIILLSILHTLFLLISNLLLFLLMPIHFSLSFILSTSVPLLLMFFIYSCRSFFSCNLNKKKNHAAMHIIINFINNHQRLPTSIKELRKTSHFYKDCHSLTEFLHSFNFFIYWRVSLLYYCNFVFHQEKIFKGIILIVLIILLEILLELLLEKKSYWLNFFLQLSNTTSHVDDDALYLAYFVAREWISRDYPEYLSEEWMQNSEFLDDVTRIH